MTQRISSEAAGVQVSGSHSRFAQYLKVTMAGAGAVGLWLTGLWLHVAPTFEAQRQEIIGVIVALTTFEIAYLCLLKNWIEGRFAQRQSKRAVAGNVRTNAERALRVTPILLLASFFPYFAYQARMNQASMVEGAKLIAEREQEVSPRAAEYLSRIRNHLDPMELLRLSQDYLASLGTRTLRPAEVRELAPGPIAFGWELVALAALSMALATLAFGWVAVLDRPDASARGHQARDDPGSV
jgi:hypothetical protein